MVMGTVALAGIAVAATGCSGSFNATTHHEDRHYEVAGPLSTLDVRLDSNEIEIVGADTDKVRVHERLNYSKKNKPTTEHRTENGSLVLRYKCPDKFTIGFSACDVGYKIEVPRKMMLKVRNSSGAVRFRGISGAADISADSGDVEGSDLRGGSVTARVDSGHLELSGAGDVNAKVDSGSIDLRDLKGKLVQASADSGNVRLRFATAPDSVIASADSGSVHLWLPANVKYAVQAGADSGSVRNHVGDDPASTHRIKAKADSGNITIDPA